MNPDPLGSVARDPAGGALPGWYLPVSTPCAIGEKTTWPIPSRRAGGDAPCLTPPPDHAVLRLVRDDPVEPHLVGNLQGRRDLIGPPLRDPDVEHLPLPAQAP